jgi:hypothetical protein
VRFAIPAFALIFAATGCALLPPPDSSETRRNALPNFAVPGQWTSKGVMPGAIGDGWLATFNDAQLDALVREAIEFNPDLRVAAGRIDQAAGYARLAGAALYPQVNLMARGGGKMSSDSSGLQGVGLFLSWELDLWGRVRSDREAARFRYESTLLDAEYARQSIAAMVAKSWFLATEARLQKANAEEMVRSSERQVTLALDRQRVGRGDEYDVSLARAGLQTYRDAVEQLELARVQALRALEALAGRYPGAAIGKRALRWREAGAGAGGPASELPERRPDVVAAERRVAAAFYAVEESRPRACRASRSSASATSVSSDLIVLMSHSNPVVGPGPGCPRRCSPAARCNRRSRSAPPSRKSRSPSTGASVRAHSARRRTPCRPNSRSLRGAPCCGSPSSRTDAHWNSPTRATAWARATCARCSNSSSRFMLRARRCCIETEQLAGNASTCTSHWAAAGWTPATSRPSSEDVRNSGISMLRKSVLIAAMAALLPFPRWRKGPVIPSSTTPRRAPRPFHVFSARPAEFGTRKPGRWPARCGAAPATGAISVFGGRVYLDVPLYGRTTATAAACSSPARTASGGRRGQCEAAIRRPDADDLPAAPRPQSAEGRRRAFTQYRHELPRQQGHSHGSVHL